MATKKAGFEIPESKKKAVRATRGKNAAGQTNGQFEKDPKGRTGGHFTGAGEAPLMKKQSHE